MNTRIKELRKQFHLTQAAFASRLGISRDALNNLERGRNKCGVPEYMVKLICYEFLVDENWLRTGEGEMHAPEPTDKLDALFGEYGCDDFDRNLIKEYLALNPEQRNVLKEYVSKVFQGGQTAEKESPGAKAPRQLENMKQRSRQRRAKPLKGKV